MVHMLEVGSLFPSFCYSLLSSFPFGSSSPMSALFPRSGEEISRSLSILFSSLFSLAYSFLYVSFLGVGARQPCGAGSRYLSNK